MSALLTPSDYRTKALELLAPQYSGSAWSWAVENLHLRDSRFDPKLGGLMRHWYDIATARLTGVPIPGDPMAHRCEELWWIIAAQIAKTTTALAIIAWVMAEMPRQIAWYDTRLKGIARLRRRAVIPMIEKTQALNNLLPLSAEARDHALGADTLQVGGSLLYLLNGNLIDDVRALPLPLIAIDEFDRLAEDLDGEGDPIDLIKVRQRTMPHDRLLMGATTPSAVTSHGWRRLCSGSHERPLVLCPDCQGADYLEDTRIGTATDHPLADYPAKVIVAERLARWTCKHCGAMHGSAAVRAMVLDAIAHRGRWVAGTWAQTEAVPSGTWTPAATLDRSGRLVDVPPPETVIRSGWANALYSQHVTLDSFAAGIAEKRERGTPNQKKTWTNTEACRPWIHIFTPSTADLITAAACADYAIGSCPVAAKWLVLTLDQQGNQAGKYWYPWVLRAWAQGGESWLVATGKAMSDAERDALEDTLYPIGTESRTPDVVAIDVANPNFRERGYRWAAGDPHRRICLRGDVRLQPGETWRAVPPPDPRHASKTSRPPEVHEWRIHPHHWRSELEERMTTGGARWHLCRSTQIPADYLKSLNSEDRTTETRRIVGGGWEEVVIWVPRVTSQTNDSVSVRKDTHWADCEKMQLALADIFGWNTPPAPTDAELRRTAKADSETDDEPAAKQDSTYADGVW